MKWEDKVNPMLARIERVAKDQGLTDQEAFDSAFHMLDWLDDLRAFAAFCENPDSYTDEQLHQMLTGFLIHVPNHVAAAAKIYTGSGVKDIFGVGALDEDDEACADE
ncbi:MAG: hypothetical protein ACF8LL_13150 [Phycisphaerales bacterium]